jgi:hypothetical protein
MSEHLKGKTDRDILLSLLASLTLCDNMSDVAGDIQQVMACLGEPWSSIEWGDLEELGDEFGKRGLVTLYGTELSGGEGT